MFADRRPSPLSSVIKPPFAQSAAPPGLPDLDARAREIFRRIVESYLESGEPVGSRTLSRGGVALSAASIRNTMQDLTEMGLLNSPHVSAGRLPTHAGLRLFVDGLLEIGDLAEEERRAIESAPGGSRPLLGRSDERGERDSLRSRWRRGGGGRARYARRASSTSSSSPSAPIRLWRSWCSKTVRWRTGSCGGSAGVTPAALTEASNFLNARLRGRTLAEARLEIGARVGAGPARTRRRRRAAGGGGSGGLGRGEEAGRALIVRGRANLLGDPVAVADLDRVRRLFDDLEQKEQLIDLLDDVRQAEAVRIFIGAETRLFSLSGSAVIAAPYISGRQRVLGAIGVIGPTRLNYARVIPLVDYTARALGRLMDGG